MSLTKPEKIRTLQRKLYLKAKAEPAFRFYQLYDKVWREDKPLEEKRATLEGQGGALGGRKSRNLAGSVGPLNRLLAGWSAYFSYDSRKAAYRAADYHVGERVRGFLGRRHKLKSRGKARSPTGPCSAGLACTRCPAPCALRCRGPCREA